MCICDTKSVSKFLCLNSNKNGKKRLYRFLFAKPLFDTKCLAFVKYLSSLVGLKNRLRVSLKLAL